MGEHLEGCKMTYPVFRISLVRLIQGSFRKSRHQVQKEEGGLTLLSKVTISSFHSLSSGDTFCFSSALDSEGLDDPVSFLFNPEFPFPSVPLFPFSFPSAAFQPFSISCSCSCPSSSILSTPSPRLTSVILVLGVPSALSRGL